MQEKLTLLAKANRNAFTLIELIIVIAILSLVLFLGVEGFSLDKHKPKALTIENLKERIIGSKLFKGQATLLCVNECKECYLRSTLGGSFTKIEAPSALRDIEVYILDEDDNPTKVEYGRYNDKKVCLVMEFYPNGSSTKLILKNDEGAYLMPSFFGKPTRFESVEEAAEYWVEQSAAMRDSGAYYR